MFEFVSAWPDEVKALNRARYRAICRMRNLEASIERVSPHEFDGMMDELEQAQEEVQALSIKFDNARRAWEWRDYDNTRSG